MTRLTNRQSLVLEMIREMIESRGFSPTSRELAAKLGITQTGAVNHIQALQRKGYISLIKGQARTIRIL